MEHQRPHFDALPRGHVVAGARVHERRVRDASRAAVRLGVEALDEQDLLGREALLVVPAVAVGVAHGEGLALARGVDERDGDEVVLADRVRVRDRQRVPLHRRDRPPHVDDLHPALEQLRGLLRRQVVRHARQRRRVRLVDVHAVHRPAQGYAAVLAGPLVRGLAADRVVEDEDLGRAGAKICPRLAASSYR